MKLWNDINQLTEKLNRTYQTVGCSADAADLFRPDSDCDTIVVVGGGGADILQKTNHTNKLYMKFMTTLPLGIKILM